MDKYFVNSIIIGMNEANISPATETFSCYLNVCGEFVENSDKLFSRYCADKAQSRNASHSCSRLAYKRLKLGLFR